MMLTHRIAPVLGIAALGLMCMGRPVAAASAHSCSEPWPEVKPGFVARIEYGDTARKIDPFITVSINRTPVKMLLDTGSNAHVVWDARLLSKASGPSPDADADANADAGTSATQTLDAIASSTQAREVFLTVNDGGRNQSVQRFYAIDETPLMAEGFSGIVSPQYLAQDNVSIIDFRNDCFFVSERFDPEGGGRYRTQTVGAIPNPHRVMAIPLDVPGGRVPVIVDSGAYRTTLLESLVRTSPFGVQRTKQVDLLGNVVMSQRRTRLVDIAANGRRTPAHPVVPVPRLSDKGVVSLGAIGMDLLRDRVIFYDGDRYQFTFIETDAKADVRAEVN